MICSRQQCYVKRKFNEKKIVCTKEMQLVVMSSQDVAMPVLIFPVRSIRPTPVLLLLQPHSFELKRGVRRWMYPRYRDEKGGYFCMNNLRDR